MKNIIEKLMTKKIEPKCKLNKHSLRELSKRRTARRINDFFLRNPDATPLDAKFALGYSITTIYRNM